MRRNVEMLLEADAKAGDFLNKTPANVGPTIDQSPADRPGTVIGPYKLLQQIGEGGMGVVWMAEQTQPVQRKVALKVIKPGMDSRQVIARFEAERQALAMMDHVNIARVLDAGTTESGLPYFVMELVHGVPITQYCDDIHLTPRERLELFVPVCQAIQHAHQKGIIHRDIKPSNVMVTLYDGKPVPKVIDFGVAKATEQTLTERTLFTQYGTMVGTLEYMSPEQAEMSALGADTRSDIFSLGVLLYELLTGSTPLTHKRLKEAAYGEILRMIREEEPPKPSTRLSDSGEAMASISALRQMEPAKLTKQVRGELDWIVMKTLEKDRNRRYETANAFAADVQRYLADEPVEACPPSAVYRVRKFARRNKVALLTAGVVAAALLVATAVSTCQAIRATQAETLAQNRLIDVAHERDEKEKAAGRAVAAAAAEKQAKERAEANFLQDRGFSVGVDALRRILFDELGLSRRQAFKDEAGCRFPQRDEQFQFIAKLRAQYERRDWPVLSIDTKRKEILGNFFHPGRALTDGRVIVQDHDFVTSQQRLVPYGVFDTRRNEGLMLLSRGSDTCRLACDAIWRWWQRLGKRHYEHAPRLLLLCDCGGSNGNRQHLFKEELCYLATDLECDIQVAHYPPGCSKYNPIEHRMFCHSPARCRRSCSKPSKSPVTSSPAQRPRWDCTSSPKPPGAPTRKASKQVANSSMGIRSCLMTSCPSSTTRHRGLLCYDATQGSYFAFGPK